MKAEGISGGPAEVPAASPDITPAKAGTNQKTVLAASSDPDRPKFLDLVQITSDFRKPLNILTVRSSGTWPIQLINPHPFFPKIYRRLWTNSLDLSQPERRPLERTTTRL